MTKNNLGFYRKQLKKLSQKLQEELKRSSDQVSDSTLELIRQIRILLIKVRGHMAKRELARILGVTAIFFGLSYSIESRAQNFNNPVNSPFGIAFNNYLNIPTTVDIDGDGDQDLFAGAYDIPSSEGNIQFHENTGTANAAQFSAPVNSPFNIDLSSLNTYAIFPIFGDLDGDGDFDMMAGNFFEGLYYFENTGTAQSPNFATPILNPFGLSDSAYYGTPVLLDLDNDGDLDLLSGEYPGRIIYYENLGTATNPSFGPKQYEPFGLQQSYYAFPTAGDIDSDGDLDLIVGDGNGDMLYFENTGTSTTPQFAAPVANPSTIQSQGVFSFPVLADMDGDSDPDLLIGAGIAQTGSTSFIYYENLAIGLGIDPLDLEDTEIYPTLVTDLISLTSNLKFSEIRLLDMAGATLRSWNSDAREFDLADLPAGSYILQLNMAKDLSIQKRLVKK